MVCKYLGNTHIDLKMDDARKNAELHSIESLSLCRKTYAGMLESVNTYNSIINDEHIRMRGIPTPYYAEQKS